jgi:hypothetical protein
MTDAFTLEGSEIPIDLPDAGITVIAPGLVGTGFYYGKREKGFVREATREQELLDEALSEAQLEDRHTLSLDAPTPSEGVSGARTRGHNEVFENEVELQVTSAVGETQFALYADEDGELSLHLPEVETTAEPTTRRLGDRVYRYRIPLRLPTGRGGKTRGVIATIAHKLIKIIVGKALQGVAQLGEYAAVRLWENRARAWRGFHSGNVTEFLAASPTAFSDWPTLEGKRSLLFLHGTTSTTSGAFDGLRLFPEVSSRFWRAYEGRILGFDHHTLSDKVVDNIIDFYEGIKIPGAYEFDVVTHSRGGLIARGIAELTDGEISSFAGRTWTRPPGVQVKFNRVVFVGTPNNGTDLADPQNLPVALDRLANVVHMLPDAALTIALGALLATAAYVSETGLKALPGLVDQAPSSSFLKALNAARAPLLNLTSYWGIEADFHPNGGIASALLDKGLDRAFNNQANDIVVPTVGVSQIASAALSSTQIKKYGAGDGVYHTCFFRRVATWEFIAAALGIPPGHAQMNTSQQ